MKKFLFLLLLSGPATAFCSNNNSLTGNWREISRRNNHDEYVYYKDTLFLNFLQNNEYIWQEKGGEAYRSKYIKQPTGIVLGQHFYNILYNNGRYMLLGDDAGYYKFERNRKSLKQAEAYKPWYDDEADANSVPYEPYYLKKETSTYHWHSSYKSDDKYYPLEANNNNAQTDNKYYPQGNNNNYTPQTDNNYTPQGNNDNYTPQTDDRYYPEGTDNRYDPGYEKGGIIGNWREVYRANNRDMYLNFFDTIQVAFLQGNEYVWFKKGSFIYRGTYINQGNSLDLGMRYFNIVSNNGNYMVLSDDDGNKYGFERYTPSGNTPKPYIPKRYKPVYDIAQMAGHWSVYKRTSNYRPSEIDYTHQLKMIDIYTSQQKRSWGDFFSTRDADNAPSWYVTGYQNQTIFCNGKDYREFRVIKCEDNELILEEAGTTYFFKQFIR